MDDPVYGFATPEDFIKAREAIRWVRAQMGNGDGPAAGYVSPSVVVLIKANSAITDGTAAPTEAGVYLCSPVYRDLRQTNPDAADAWVEYGPAENHYCEAFGPNKETLIAGKRYVGRGFGTSEVAPFRPRILIGMGGGGQTRVFTTAVNTGGSWTPATMHTYDSLGELVATGETVSVKPMPGATCGTDEWWETDDTGAVSPSGVSGTDVAGRRRLRLTGRTAGVINVPVLTDAYVTIPNVAGITFTGTVTCNPDKSVTVNIAPSGSIPTSKASITGVTSKMITVSAEHLKVE